MGAIGHDGLAVPGRVELAHEPPFRLGILDVQPSTRQLLAFDRSETIEPRVMQVLVALFRAGNIVTRDELTDRCWGGRIVGDDAINRVLSRIRHIATDIGRGSFSVETITKVGYRLQVVGSTPPATAGSATFASNRRKAVVAIVGSGLAAAVGGGVAWRLIGASRQPKEAEELFERALMLRGAASEADNRQAIAYLREAVRISPKYGEAWGALAFAYRGELLSSSLSEAAGLEDRLQEALRQADRYDPGNADAAFARQLKSLYFGRWATMEPIYRDLARQYPNHPTGHYLLGSLLMDVGRWGEAVAALRAAKRHNALAPIARYKLTVSLWSAGRISEAEHEIDEAMRWSIHSAIWQTKIKLLAMTGRPAAALAIVNDAENRPVDTNEEQLDRWRLFLVGMMGRDAADVDRAVEGLIGFARKVPTPIPEAFQCAMLGRPELALSILEGCYLGIGEWATKRPADQSGSASHPLFQPQARSLWRDARFDRILKEIGLEHYWRSTNSQPDYRRA